MKIKKNMYDFDLSTASQMENLLINSCEKEGCTIFLLQVITLISSDFKIL